MRTAPRVALAGSLVLLALAGCRTSRVIQQESGVPWQQQEAALQKLDRYSLSGRVAVAANGEGFSGSLRYRQQPERSDMSLDGPMGIGGMRVQYEGENVSITTSRGDNLDGIAAREELERRLGFALPLHQLRWWLLGIPEPKGGMVERTEANHPDRLVGFEQDGWKVSINSHAPAMGYTLPQRLTIEREGARLKLLVDRWQP